MRFKYYKLTLRQMGLKRPFVFSILIIIFVLFTFVVIMLKRVEPVIGSLCESSAHRVALDVTNEVVADYIKSVDYATLIEIKQDNNGKIISLNANVMEMNKITTGVSSEIQKKLNNLKDVHIKLPLGSFFNAGVLSGYGPNIPIDIMPSGVVMAKFNSDFQQAGVNQTRHRIFLEVTTKIKIIAPFYSEAQEYTNQIIVAETIIVGDTPQTYYNINGLNSDNMLDIVN